MPILRSRYRVIASLLLSIPRAHVFLLFVGCVVLLRDDQSGRIGKHDWQEFGIYPKD